ETGVLAAQEFAALVPVGLTAAQAAIAGVWQQPGVTTVIPGARNVAQARSNAAAGRAAPLGDELLDGVRRIYDERFRAAVHDRW
ncbi:MAG: aldo/keto reductase, partial [Nocardioides sp.]|nr:aldo/keto reductase [Nocardioides sp.]